MELFNKNFIFLPIILVNIWKCFLACFAEIDKSMYSSINFKNRLKKNSQNWILIFIVTFLYIVVYYKLTSINTNMIRYVNVQIVGLLLILLIIILFNKYLGKEVQKQRYSKKLSWLYYNFWASYWFINVICYLERIQIKYLFWVLIASSSIYAACYYFYLNKKIKIQSNCQFAPESIGINGSDDCLKFKDSAKNQSEGLKQLSYDKNEYVNVFAIYGDQGEGKSSYSRMIVESLSAEDILYTYISLTETNESSDFSKLFSERWFNTLGDKYPKIDTNKIIPIMQSISQESNRDLVSVIISMLPFLNISIMSTKIKFKDKYENNKNENVSREISQIFGGINEFNEKQWIVVVDEIERATFSEIYRVIETIERFKYKGRSGLPIQLIFILCISKKDLDKKLKVFKDKDELAGCILNFFEDSKNIEKNIYLPPVSIESRESFVKKQIEETFNRFKDKDNSEKIKENIQKFNEAFIEFNFEAIKEDFPEGDAKAINYILGILSQQSLRMIKRCVSNLDHYFYSWLDLSGQKQFFSVSPAYLLLISYIQIEYPYVIDFFRKTIDIFDGSLKDNCYIQDKIRENKSLVEYIEKEIDFHINDEVIRKEVYNLIWWVANFYPREFKENRLIGVTNNNKKYMGTFSDTSLLKSFLYSVYNGDKSDIQKNYDIFIAHTKDSDANGLKLLSDSELIKYAHFIRVESIGNKIPSVFVDIIIEIKSRLTTTRSISSIEDGNIDSFAFLIGGLIVTKIFNSDERIYDEIKKKTADIIFDVFKHKTISLEAKYILADYIISKSNRSNSISKYAQEIELIANNNDINLKTTLKGIFEEIYQRYHKKSIYHYEENPFYVLYQSWSGRQADKKGIKKLSKIANRGLKNNATAIEKYWKQYPDPSESFDLIKFHSIGRSLGMFVHTEYLLVISLLLNNWDKFDDSLQEKINKWQEIMDNKDNNKEWGDFKESTKVQDDDTLYRRFLNDVSL